MRRGTEVDLKQRTNKKQVVILDSCHLGVNMNIIVGKLKSTSKL